MARYESDPILQQIVDRYDESGLVVKTNHSTLEPTTQYNEPESEVSKMAKHALKRKKK